MFIYDDAHLVLCEISPRLTAVTVHLNHPSWFKSPSSSSSSYQSSDDSDSDSEREEVGRIPCSNLKDLLYTALLGQKKATDK